MTLPCVNEHGWVKECEMSFTEFMGDGESGTHIEYLLAGSITSDSVDLIKPFYFPSLSFPFFTFVYPSVIYVS